MPGDQYESVKTQYVVEIRSTDVKWPCCLLVTPRADDQRLLQARAMVDAGLGLENSGHGGHGAQAAQQ